MSLFSLKYSDDIQVANSADLSERKVPFDAQFEALTSAQAEPGFSGGGVFSLNGEYLGALVRGDTKDGKFSRFVKVDFIFQELRAAYQKRLPKLTEEILEGSGLEQIVLQ